MTIRTTLKRAKNELLYRLTMGSLGLLGRLPLYALLRLGYPLGIVAWLAAAKERKRATRNLQVSDLSLSARERRRIVRDLFVGLGRSAVECIALHREPATFGGDGRVRFAAGARECLSAAVGEGKGVVIATGHYGNWELLGACVARIAPVYVLARRSYDPRFSALITRFRSAHGVRTLWVEDLAALRRALRALRQGAIVGLLVDQPVRHGGRSLSFVGRPAPTSPLVEGLIGASGAALLVALSQRTADRTHRVSIERVSGGERAEAGSACGGQGCSVHRVTQALEVAVRRDPASWLWTLDRWGDRWAGVLSAQESS